MTLTFLEWCEEVDRLLEVNKSDKDVAMFEAEAEDAYEEGDSPRDFVIFLMLDKRA